MKPQKARGDLILATEAVFDDDNLRAKVTIIRPGMSKNRKNWTAEVLKKASESGFWNGSRMFIDHAKTGDRLPTRRRSMREMVSAIEKTEVADDGRIVADVVFFDEDFYKWARRAKDHIGTSVDLLFAGKEVRERGQQPYYAVEELVTNNSVDWVLDPAAGGQIESFVTAQEGENDVEWNELTADMLQQHRPDLVQALEAKGTTPPPSGGSTPPLTAEDVAKLVKDNLKAAREEWDQEQTNRDNVRKQYAAVIQGTKLPQRTQIRLMSAFEGVDTFDQARVDAAIKEAQEEFRDAGVRPQIRGAGPSDAGTTTQLLREVSPVHAAMEQTFKVPVASGKKSTEGGND